jgi:outer membrane immunogenic protein
LVYFHGRNLSFLSLGDFWVKKIMLGAVALVAIGAAPALAADLPAAPVYTKAPAIVAPVYNWTGFYIGVNAGGEWGRSDVATFVDPNIGTYVGTANSAIMSAAGTGRAKNTSFTGGGQIGYNYQSGMWLWGLEADLEYIGKAKLDQVGALTAGFTGGSAFESWRIGDNWLATFRPRVGVAMNQWLLYVTGGLAVTGTDAAWTYRDTAPALLATGALNPGSGLKAGWTVGAGFEYALNQNWSVKGEYLYANFQSSGAAIGNITAPGGSFEQTTVSRGDLSLQIARVGVNYRFGGPVVAKY